MEHLLRSAGPKVLVADMKEALLLSVRAFRAPQEQPEYLSDNWPSPRQLFSEQEEAADAAAPASAAAASGSGSGSPGDANAATPMLAMFAFPPAAGQQQPSSAAAFGSSEAMPKPLPGTAASAGTAPGSCRGPSSGALLAAALQRSRELKGALTAAAGSRDRQRASVGGTGGANAQEGPLQAAAQTPGLPTPLRQLEFDGEADEGDPFDMADQRGKPEWGQAYNDAEVTDDASRWYH